MEPRYQHQQTSLEVTDIVADIRAILDTHGEVQNEQLFGHYIPSEGLIEIILVAEQINLAAIRKRLSRNARFDWSRMTTFTIEWRCSIAKYRYWERKPIAAQDTN